MTLIDSERVESGTEGEGSMGNETRCEASFGYVRGWGMFFCPVSPIDS